MVRSLFGPAPNPVLWYSLAPNLRPLAEAAPEEFLTAVQRDVLGDTRVRATLFQEEGLFGGSRHTNLLWALETLAWSPVHLTRVALILAGLAAHDPGGRTANRPHASLRSIFTPWHPQTMAPLPGRLAAIDIVRRRYPRVAFELYLHLARRGVER